MPAETDWRRVTFRDPNLPHQIVLSMSGNEIKVSCNCLAGLAGGIESRTLWEPGEAIQAYRDWHAAKGVALEPAKVG